MIVVPGEAESVPGSACSMGGEGMIPHVETV